jgi:hypothetical protein
MMVICGLCYRRVLVGSIRDRVGQLGESGEYQMERVRVVWIINSELQGGSPRLCRITTASVVPPATSIELRTDAYGH